MSVYIAHQAGRITHAITYSPEAPVGDYVFVDTPPELVEKLFSEYGFFDGSLVYIGPPASPFHNIPTVSGWLPNLDAAREAKVQQVAAELNKRLYLPCNGFDADNVSRERISGTIARLQRGDGLPAGWLGWRDADNNMHWATDDAATVLANLTALSCAIEDREQALLIAAWQHKANIAALTDIDAIIGYDATTGWPT